MSKPSLAETKILETKEEEKKRFLELGIFNHIIHFHLPPFSCSDDIWRYMPNCSFMVLQVVMSQNLCLEKLCVSPENGFIYQGKFG